MKQTITMPALSDTMNVGRLSKWLKQPGDKVRKGDAVAEVETDKAVMEVEAFHDGYLAGPLAKVDVDIALGAPIAYIVDEPGEAGEAAAVAPVAATPPPAAPAAPTPAAAPVPAATGARASPYARRLAAQLGMDLARPLSAADILAAAHPASGPDLDGGPPYRIERNSSLREAVAQTMIASAGTPTFRVTAELPLVALVTIAKAHGLSVNLLLARAASFAIREHPLFNAVYTPDGIAWRDRIDVAIAVDSPVGLITPVLRDVAARSFADLAEDWHGLLEKAATRRIKPEEYRGATFYISDLGVFPVVHSFESIIPSGAAALLSVAALRGETALGTLNCDHRVVFGGDAARFLQSFVTCLGEFDRLIA